MRKIGIIGGGQLGRMAIEEAGKYGAHVSILASEWPCPAGDLADEIVLGSLSDAASILELGELSEVLSYEIENVNAEALRDLEARGKLVLPSSKVLSLIQDKAAQKRLWDKAGIPSAPWALVEAAAGASAGAIADVLALALDEAAASLGGYPVVQKARRGGYDGRGVRPLASAAEARGPGLPIDAPSLVEARVDFEKELAVIVARSATGAVAYPCVEMVFDPRVNLCESVLAPARVGEATRRRAEEVALSCVEALAGEAAAGPGGAAGAAGVYGVELFLTKGGEVLVNEVAPRPHNSGHYSIEACVSSQFDQYLRILLGLPLGSPDLLSPAMMVNLLGEEGESGQASFLGLEKALALPGVTLHLYGKREVWPFRKMGHLTALGRTAEEAMERAAAARALIRVVAAKP